MNVKRLILGLLSMLCLLNPAAAEIKSGSAIQITIAGVPPDEKGSFEQFVVVANDGTINMPYIGQVRAAGLQGHRLAKLLEQKYKEAGIYTRPTFQVLDSSDKKIEELFVTVGGRVRRSGNVEYNRALTLWQAIQQAGGPDEFGSMRRVQLTRGSSVTEHNCETAEGKGVRLQPGDSINVPEKNWLGG